MEYVCSTSQSSLEDRSPHQQFRHIFLLPLLPVQCQGQRHLGGRDDVDGHLALLKRGEDLRWKVQMGLVKLTVSLYSGAHLS